MYSRDTGRGNGRRGGGGRCRQLLHVQHVLPVRVEPGRAGGRDVSGEAAAGAEGGRGCRTTRRRARRRTAEAACAHAGAAPPRAPAQRPAQRLGRPARRPGEVGRFTPSRPWRGCRRPQRWPQRVRRTCRRGRQRTPPPPSCAPSAAQPPRRGAAAAAAGAAARGGAHLRSPASSARALRSKTS